MELLNWWKVEWKKYKIVTEHSKKSPLNTQKDAKYWTNMFLNIENLNIECTHKRVCLWRYGVQLLKIGCPNTEPICEAKLITGWHTCCIETIELKTKRQSMNCVSQQTNADQ
jgi:hypothetical protein